MRKNKHIRVEDSPVVANTVTPPTSDGVHIFQLGDSSHSSTLNAIGGDPVLSSRLIIPMDNSEGSVPLACFLTGNFTYTTDVPAGDNLVMMATVETYWEDLDPGMPPPATNQGRTLNGGNLNNSPLYKITSLAGSISYGGDGYGFLPDQIHFISGGVLAAGESLRFLYVDLYLEDMWSSYSVTTSGNGPFVTGYVVEDPSIWAFESFEGAPEDEPANWPASAGSYYGGGDEGGHAWTAGSSNFPTSFPWYNELP